MLQGVKSSHSHRLPRSPRPRLPRWPFLNPVMRQCQMSVVWVGDWVWRDPSPPRAHARANVHVNMRRGVDWISLGGGVGGCDRGARDTAIAPTGSRSIWSGCSYMGAVTWRGGGLSVVPGRCPWWMGLPWRNLWKPLSGWDATSLRAQGERRSSRRVRVSETSGPGRRRPEFSAESSAEPPNPEYPIFSW